MNVVFIIVNKINLKLEKFMVEVQRLGNKIDTIIDISNRFKKLTKKAIAKPGFHNIHFCE